MMFTVRDMLVALASGIAIGVLVGLAWAKAAAARRRLGGIPAGIVSFGRSLKPDRRETLR